MATAKNKVIGGDYIGYSVKQATNGLVLVKSGKPKVEVNKDTVKDYTEKFMDDSRSIARGVARQAMFGVGGAASKNIAALIEVSFKDGHKSLVEIDPQLYRTLISVTTAGIDKVETRKGHSLILHILLCCVVVGFFTIPYYSISKNHYWHA